MSETPDSSESQLRKFLQEWWALITTISTSLAGLLAALIGDGTAKIVGFVLSLVMVGVAIIIWIKQEKKKKAKKETEERVQGYKTSNETSSFRGLYSFKESDFLPGSDRQRQAKLIFTQIIDPNFSFGIICGESGCGKSSVLNAGIVKQLKASGRKVTLIEKDKNLFSKEDLPVYLGKIKENLVANNNQEEQFLIVDQFEEFLISWLELEERQKIGLFFYSLLKINVKVLLVLRKDYLADINDFEPNFPNPISSKNIFYVKNFTTNEAKEIIEVCAKRDGLVPSDELVEVLVRDLTNDGYIRPVQLQIVCTALLTSFDLNSYRINGGVTGILSSYVKDAINVCSNPDLAKKILRSLCDFSAKAKSEPKTFTSIKEEIGTNLDENAVQGISTQLENSRIIIFIHDNDIQKVRIVHDYLVESINIATSSIATNQERANQLVKYYFQNIQSSNIINVNSKDIHFIRANADKELINDPRFIKLVKKNRVRTIYKGGSYFVVLAITTTIFVAVITQKSYWKDEILDYHLGENKVPISTTIYPHTTEGYVVTGTFWGLPYAYVWDIKTGRKLYTMEGDKYLDLNGKLILTWDRSESAVYLHDLVKKNKIQIPNGLFTEQNILGSDIDGNLIAMKSEEKDSVYIWYTRENKKSIAFQCSVGFGRQGVEFDQSLTKIFVNCKKDKNDRGNNAIGVWDISNGKFIKFLLSADTSEVDNFIISEKTNKVFTIEATKNIKPTYKLVAWDLSSLSKIKEAFIEDEGALRLSDNERFVWITDDYGSYFRLSKDKPIILNTVNLTPYNEVTNIGLSILVDHYLIFNRQDSNKTYISDIGKEITYEINYKISNLAQAPIIKNDSSLIFFDKNKSVQIWNFKNNSKVTFDKIDDAMSVNLTLDKNMVQVNQGGNKVVVIDPLKNKPTADLSIGSDSYDIYYNSQCNYFIVWTGDGRILKYIKTRSILGKEFYSTNCKN